MCLFIQSPHLPENVVDTVGRGRRLPGNIRTVGGGGRGDHQVGFIGNVVGALKVEIIGHRRSIEKSALIKAITGLSK